MRILVFFGLFVLFVGGFAFGGPPIHEVFSDCDFYRFGGSFAGVDTLWFSTTAPVNQTKSGDWFGVDAVPVGVNNDGVRIYERRTVKKVLAYSREPFRFREYAAGVGSPGAAVAFAIVDTVGGTNTGPSALTDAYPCWTVFSYPDSLRLAESGSDTVFYYVGY